ncbi:MAG TPA: hypothetical protein VL523_14185 [Terriglobia bacterium]|nr:hypothetical protein [Terriglobia bacterium]
MGQLDCLCSPEPLKAYRRPALVVGHPGHELRVFGWAAERKPRVYVLTDGSGRGGSSRLPSTARLLSRIGAEAGEVFGALSDAGVYRALLERTASPFLTILNTLTRSFLENEVDFVAGDAREGFNPTHDLCRTMVNSAVAIAQRETGRTLPNYEVCLTEWEHGFEQRHDGRCLHYRLDDSLLGRKLEAAQGYTELRDEVERALATQGKGYFQVECLRRLDVPHSEPEPSEKPYYETWGEQRVAEGGYRSAIRYRGHVLPIVDAIRRFARGSRNTSTDSSRA